MNRNIFFSLLIVGLLASNIGLVFMLGGKKDHHKKHHGPKNQIIKKLQFTPEQIEQYQALIEIHKTGVTNKEEIIRQNKKALHKLLLEEMTPTVAKQKDQLLNNIATDKKAIEQLHFEHFAAIKEICTTTQLVNYKELVHELGSMFSHHKHRPHPRK